MSAQFHAWVAAVGSADERYSIVKAALCGAMIFTAVMLAGCTPETTRMASADPADPTARVAGAGYRSTVAPYTSLRPSTPAPWRERNDSVTPKSRREQP
ncbi:hypothetical protein [Bradyrhizobium paxllaeri]|uniref:hypothetical protein n=1 Tax=Bradyrhizobium paxllaeri TaxID=190148 RepID=UPI000A03481E|nr:hypothetical protein [Bradyrhizobium paxllaeri]